MKKNGQPNKVKPGPKPVTISLYPLTPEEALSAFMRLDPKKVKKVKQKAKV
jgi:hypothetical protein